MIGLDWYKALGVGCSHIGTPLAVYSGRDDPSCVTRTFAAREEAVDSNMLQCLIVTEYADR